MDDSIRGHGRCSTLNAYPFVFSRLAPQTAYNGSYDPMRADGFLSVFHPDKPDDFMG
ncbi:hypothetical protein Gxy13693_046_038 [Komagataeibacter xylinus NBRC 13693]|uniref:Uncharacterized protein n=1 Tax=Komagataeibacter xylinus NBRC 13693 TaxID=1234668 RepID=A0A0D6QC77_KOMXY|nr:hypothetical protein Gxy13693_046_038 [Komagataeibacter xylinus NBRC 13693]